MWLLLQVAIIYTSSSSEDAVDDLSSKIEALQNKSGATKIRADLRQIEAPKAIVESTLSAFPGGSIDVLVNNAGCELVKQLEDIILEDFDHVYDLNVRATMLMTQAVLPYLRQPGQIINISSVGARAGFAGLSAYCSSKAAMEGFTRCWAAELGPTGHTVNAVMPGHTETARVGNIPKSVVEMQKSQTPEENWLGKVDDISRIVAFLAEEGSRWVSGQVISASGGWSMY